MKLKNFLMVVNDIETSKTFYQELFGLQVLNDLGENVILTEGLVLQEKKLWEESIEKSVSFSGNDAELYFEETDMDSFLQKLNQSKWSIEYVNPLVQDNFGQRVLRLYDPDKHVIEVREIQSRFS
jgi:catechol 2,3-dioxygenase-like lactoylglutathione lyase family enzyme